MSDTQSTSPASKRRSQTEVVCDHIDRAIAEYEQYLKVMGLSPAA